MAVARSRKARTVRKRIFGLEGVPQALAHVGEGHDLRKVVVEVTPE